MSKGDKERKEERGEKERARPMRPCKQVKERHMVILLKQNHWVWLEFVISSVDSKWHRAGL